ncbi:MAG: isochorismatase family cysteine hydrolase [Acutalibacteraceae bacterium]|nr:isochorismatase family cysteine hydrolase [Acutalibacteraceae bacterium]
MKKLLIVVDMQKDFVNGNLGSEMAEAIVPNVVNKIESFNGDIIATYDTHFENYMETTEGKKLPVPHCIKGTNGWKLDSNVQIALDKKGFTAVEKNTFGSIDLPKIISDNYNVNNIEIELVGLCTDICVVSNALLLKANFPEIPITVDASCCAGVSVETHNSAIATMRCCQINIIGE